jgi:NAD(P)-dependent dehydrogenase (short-subunit alcohol dehydrogenase family)
MAAEAGAVLITGGGAGLGQALAERLLAEGRTVAVIDRDVAAAPAGAIALAADVTDEAAVGDAVAEIAARGLRIAGLATAAGTARSGPAEAMDAAAWRHVLDVNVVGTAIACRAAFPHLARGGGAIATFASVNGLGGHAARANYCASKAAVIGLTQSLAIEWGRHGIRVNAVAPSVVLTDRVRAALPQDFLDGVVLDRTPLDRLGTATEVCAAVAFLLSDAAAFVTGAVLPVDGGLMAGPFTRRSGRDLQLPRG